MSYQVLRVEKFLKNDLLKIGAETERTAKHHRNEDIDSERTPLNYYFKKSEGGLSAQWKKVIKDFGITFKKTKKTVAFEGIIVTSDTAFFEKLGWIRGHPTPDAVKQFFCDCYDFILREIGFRGGDENILSAVVHMDETTPQLQLYYVPLVDERRKVFRRGQRLYGLLARVSRTESAKNQLYPIKERLFTPQLPHNLPHDQKGEKSRRKNKNHILYLEAHSLYNI